MAALENEELFEIFNHKNSQEKKYSEIAQYLINKYPYKIVWEDALEIARILYEQEFLNPEQIKSGAYNSLVDKYAKSYILRRNSVYNENEKRIEKPLQSKKKPAKHNRIVKSAVLTIAGVALVFTFKNMIPNIEKQSVSHNLGKLASSYGTYDYKQGLSIVYQNTYRFYGNDTNEMIIAYHNDRIANDIISVCTREPELFEMCLNNVYNDMNYERLKNMDEVLKYLKLYMSQDAALAPLYEKIVNNETFLDYVVSRGFVNSDSKEYYSLMQAIDNYKKLGKNFNNLAKEEQELITKLMQNYAKNFQNLYREYNDELKEAVKEQQQEFKDSNAPKIGG